MNILKKYTSNLTAAQTAVAYGVFAGVVFVLIIMLARVISMPFILKVRFINFPILFGITYLCLLNLKERYNNRLAYLKGLWCSVLVGGASIAVLSAYIFFYLKFFDKALLEYLIQNAPFGWLLNPTNAAFWPAHELFGAQILYALIIMEYIKYLQAKAGVKTIE